MDKYIGCTVRDPNTPANIKRRIASLRKQLAKHKKVQKLLNQEQYLRDCLAIAGK